MPDRENMLLGLRDLQSLPPTFFIGLGGSGGRVVDTLAQRLRREPSWPLFRSLINFVVIDTDQNDLNRISERCSVSNISLNYKRRRITLLRGEKEHEANTRTTSWIHPWYGFRDTSGKGSGQVRLESRFSLHCQIAEGRPGNVRSLLQKRLSQALAAHNPARDVQRPVRFFFYGSLAGGTGSGSNLTMAYLVRQLAYEMGTTCKVYGTFFLPSVFRQKVDINLHSKINANAYAALLELEHCQEMRYEGTGPDKVELVFDPQLSQSREVDPRVDVVEHPAYDWIYFADLPEAMTIEQITAAVGEAAYLQLFSPILGFQEREGDNFEQLQSEARDGYFAMQYGSIGASVLQFPRRRLVRYCARRQAIDLLGRFVVGNAGSEGPEPLDITDEDFEKLSKEEQNRLVDKGFVQFIAQQAQLEEQDNRKGIFTEIKDLRSANANVLDMFRTRLQEELDKAETLIDIMPLNAAALTRESCSLGTARNNLRRDYQNSRQALDAAALTLQSQITSGRFFGRFFQDYKVSPLLQRYLLLQIDVLARNEILRGDGEGDELLDWCFVPYENPEDGLHLASKPIERSAFHVDEAPVRKQIQDCESSMRSAAERYRDKHFIEAAYSAVRLFERLDTAARDALIVDFWHQISRTLQNQVEKRLSVFRTLARKGLNNTRHLLAQAEYCRERGLVVPDIGKKPDKSSTFHLGHEVFHDARQSYRQWDQVYRLWVRPGVKIAPEKVLSRVNEVLEAHSSSRQTDARDSDKVLGEVTHAIDQLCQETIAALIDNEKPLNIGNGLELEARIAVAMRHPEIDLEQARLSMLDAIDTMDLEPYLVDKLRRVADMSRSLGRFDEGVISTQQIPVYSPRFCGIAEQFMAGNELLHNVLSRATGGFDRLEDWESNDLMSFYQARLGVTLYCYLEVMERLQPAYEFEVKSNRKQPLHIDVRWERKGFNEAKGPGLPSLKRDDRHRWEVAIRQERQRLEEARKREREEEARTRELERKQAYQDFIVNLAVGQIQTVRGRAYQLQLGQTIVELGPSLDAALEAFCAMDSGQRGLATRRAQRSLDDNPSKLQEARQHLDAVEEHLFGRHDVSDALVVMEHLNAALKRLRTLNPTD